MYVLATLIRFLVSSFWWTSSSTIFHQEKEAEVKLMIDSVAAEELESLRRKHKLLLDENNELSVKVIELESLRRKHKLLLDENNELSVKVIELDLLRRKHKLLPRREQ